MSGPSHPELRIALVFPPAMSPTAPPLGIAALKAHLQSRPGLAVRNFDLNLAYFEQSLQWLADRRLQMRLRNMDSETTAEKAVRAADFFRGKKGLEAFFDLNAYNENAKIYDNFSSVLNGLFDNFSRRIILGLPLPPLVSRFFDDLIAPVKAFEPDVVGLSILFSQQLFFALAAAKLLRRDSNAKIAFGGATFSVMPDPGRLLSGPVPVYMGGTGREADIRPLIDYLFVGEGEKSLESLASLLLSNGEPESRAFGHVPGLIQVRDGKPEMNPAQAVSDLNSLPLPDFSDFPLNAYHSPVSVLPYLASRGCPWRRCAFCTHQKTYLEYREEAAENTAERLSALRDAYGVDHFSLVDEMVYPRRMEKLAEALIRNDARIHFSAYAKPSGFSVPVFEKAHRAGLRLLLWGFESASQRLLDLMDKGTNARNIAAILASARDAGIWNLLFVIQGFPTETKEEWLATMDFLETNRESVHAVSRSLFILLEGSKLFGSPRTYGINRIIDRPQRDPVSIAYDCEVAEGLTRQEAQTMFSESADRLARLGRSPWFGRFREHMLLFASRRQEML